jgi:hypothetical protein
MVAAKLLTVPLPLAARSMPSRADASNGLRRGRPQRRSGYRVAADTGFDEWNQCPDGRPTVDLRHCRTMRLENTGSGSPPSCFRPPISAGCNPPRHSSRVQRPAHLQRHRRDSDVAGLIGSGEFQINAAHQTRCRLPNDRSGARWRLPRRWNDNGQEQSRR